MHKLKLLKPLARAGALFGLVAAGCGRAAPVTSVLKTGAPRVGRSSFVGPNAPSASARGLSFTTTDVDVGLSNGTIKQEYPYINTGDAPLDIIAVTPSCSCTVPHVNPLHLEPGGSGVLTLETDLNRKPPGRHVFVIDVDFECTGQSRQRTRLALRAQNRPDVWIEPDKIVMHVRAGGKCATLVRIDDCRDAPLRILGAKLVGVEGVKATVPTTAARANGVWSYFVELVADAGNPSPDRVCGDLVVLTDDARRSEMHVPIELVTTRRVVAIPRTVWLLRDSGNGALRGQVSLRDSEGHAVEVENIACACAFLAWEKTRARFGPASATFDLTLPEQTAGALKFPLEVRLRVVSPCNQEVSIELMPPLGWRPFS